MVTTMAIAVAADRYFRAKVKGVKQSSKRLGFPAPFCIEYGRGCNFSVLDSLFC